MQSKDTDEWLKKMIFLCYDTNNPTPDQFQSLKS